MPRVYLNKVFLFRGFSLITGGSGTYPPRWRGYQCIYKKREREILCVSELISVYLFPGKRHKPLLPEIGVGLRDSTFDVVAHEADLALIDRIVEMRQPKDTLTDLTVQLSTVLPDR